MSQASLKPAAKYPLCPREGPSDASRHRELSATLRENSEQKLAISNRSSVRERETGGERDEMKHQCVFQFRVSSRKI